jgi:transposase-like protein
VPKNLGTVVVKKGLFINGCKKNNKKCPNCSKNNTRKRGKQKGLTRYFCNDCRTLFSSKRRPSNLQEIIFKKYVYNRQILKNLAEDYNRSLPWVRKQILKYNTPLKIHNPREIVIVCDVP